MISLLSNSAAGSSPDANLFAAMLTLVDDPAAARARLAEIERVAALASKALDDARTAILDAKTQTEAVGKREIAVADREAKAAIKDADLKKRESDLAFRERHIADLTRKAQADGKAAADLRSELERKLSAVRTAIAA